MYSYKTFCIFHLFVEKTLGQICIKFCMRGHLADVIYHVKFYLNQIRDFDSVGGRIFAFPIEKRSHR